MSEIPIPRRNIILFVGENRVIRDRDVARWREIFATKYGTDSITIIDRDAFATVDLAMELSQIGLFASTRLIVFTDGALAAPERTTSDEDGEEGGVGESITETMGMTRKEREASLLRSLATLPDSTYILFVVSLTVDSRAKRSPPRPNCPKKLYESLRSIATIKEYPVFPPSRMVVYIRERLPDVSDDAVSLLLTRTAGNISVLDHELDRLALYGTEASITRTIVEQEVADTTDSSIFSLVDAVLGISPREAHRHFKRLLIHNHIYQIFASLMSNIRTYLFVRHLLDLRCSSDRIMNLLGISSYQIDKASGFQRRDEVEGFFRRCMDIERSNRTGSGPGGPEGLELMLEMEILTLNLAKDEKTIQWGSYS